MGGCKCLFRGCQVSTAKNPSMHFFHFPVKNEEHFKMWVKMSGAKDVLELPTHQQRNRVVCARHFRDECFNNYKKDRLLKLSTPTLFRLDSVFALDYKDISTADEKPKLIRLEKTQKPHLLPPPTYKCLLGFDEKTEAGLSLLYLNYPDFEASRLAIMSRKKRTGVLKDESEVKKKPRILNLRMSLPKTAVKENDIVVLNLENYNETMSTERDCQSMQSDNNTAELDNIEYDNDAYLEPMLQETRSDSQFLIDRLAEACEKLKSFEEKNKKTSQQLNDALEENLKLQRKNLIHMAQIAELEESTACLRDEHQKLKASYTQLKSATQQINLGSTPGNGAQQISKGKLFNGTKKYLNASMAALLSMEMFGSAERQWKSDERRTAVDLLRLDEDGAVYKYFCDEWRFRLPSLETARTWLTEDTGAVDEEDL